VCEVVRRRWGGLQRSEYELCVALFRLFRDNVHRSKGFSKFSDYTEVEFEIPEKLTWTFAYLGRDLGKLPKTRAAVESGELTYTKAREFARKATPETEAFWVEFARSHTNREIEQRVREADGEEREKEVRQKLSPKERQAARKAKEKLEKKLGKKVQQEKVLSGLATLFAEGGMDDAKSDPETPAPKKPRPYLTIQLCPSCLDTWVPVPKENAKVDLEEWLEALKSGAEVIDLIGGRFCDCEDRKHRRDCCPHTAPRTGEPATSRHVPAEVRKAVEARDGFRCRVPGCGCTGPLEFSHLERFADGAPMIPEVLAQHCATHNSQIESGALGVRGQAPYEHYWQSDGTYLGVGYDPVPRTRRFSHVGNGEDETESQDAATGPPGEGRKRPA
jgi:uncharacterized protein YifE (UPF0438 family)